MDVAERSGSNLTFVLLDWEKAFDKIDQDKLIQVLKRLQIPEHLLALITNFYKDPKFSVKTMNGISSEHSQQSGIRQGCPPSSYLFTIVMSAMFEDIKNRLRSKRQNEPIDGIEFSQILYADDTLFFGTKTRNLNIFIKAIE
jgi:hypothetical protein